MEVIHSVNEQELKVVNILQIVTRLIHYEKIFFLRRIL